jgi:hypothetical protein
MALNDSMPAVMRALESVEERMSVLQGQADAMCATLYRIATGVDSLAHAMTMNEISAAAHEAINAYRAALRLPAAPT